LTLRHTIIALLCLVAIGGGAAHGKTRALVVGINQYPDIRVNGVPGARDLRGAVNDARNMQEALVKHLGVKPDEVKVLTDAEASRDGIISQFRSWLIEGTENGDRAIFYFAGHGAQIDDEDGDEGEDKFDEVLVPSDTSGELEGADAGLSGFITDDEIGSLLADLSGREVITIVDACHSGTITRGSLEVRRSGAADDIAGQEMAEPADGYSGVRTLTPNGPIGVSTSLEALSTRSMHRTGTRLIEVVAADAAPAASAPQQLASWTAAASAQLAMEDLALGGSQGLFTNRFVQGIANGAADLNKNGNVTAAELLSFLRQESEAYCSEYRCGPGGLTPTLEAWNGYDGEVIASYAAAEPQPTPEYVSSVASSDALPEQGYAAGGGVTVTLAGGGSLAYGDALRIKIVSEHPGELIVLDVRDDGTTVQLFPNSPSLKVGAQTFVMRGEARFLPGDEDPFQLVPDARGSGRIIALVVDERSPIGAITEKYLDLEPIPSPEDYVAAIGREINRTVAYPAGSEEALYRPASGATLARGEARYVIR
jgi:hypothetical protein